MNFLVYRENDCQEISCSVFFADTRLQRRTTCHLIRQEVVEYQDHSHFDSFCSDTYYLIVRSVY